MAIFNSYVKLPEGIWDVGMYMTYIILYTSSIQKSSLPHRKSRCPEAGDIREWSASSVKQCSQSV